MKEGGEFEARRPREVVLMAQNRNNKEIAALLGISVSTVSDDISKLRAVGFRPKRSWGGSTPLLDVFIRRTQAEALKTQGKSDSEIAAIQHIPEDWVRKDRYNLKRQRQNPTPALTFEDIERWNADTMPTEDIAAQTDSGKHALQQRNTRLRKKGVEIAKEKPGRRPSEGLHMLWLEAFRLRTVIGKTRAEIAQALHVTPAKVRDYLYRGKKLQEMLDTNAPQR